jgi:hypothetical protein
MQNALNSGFHFFPNYGYLVEDIPLDIFAEIRKEVRKIKSDMENFPSATSLLSGNIEQEFTLTECNNVLEPYVLRLVKSYDDHFNYIKSINSLDTDLPLGLTQLWVNFQKKHEFNPNHNHSGVFSFVIWVKLPYELKEELDASPGKYSNGNVASAFQFTYSDTLGNLRTHSLFLDKSSEGKILLFPNKMIHCVYPFYTSDEYRISVSGNISLKVKND